MAQKIFRIYEGGSNTIKGWEEISSFPYNSTNRDTIKDPNGAKATHQITSIPSPFARIDLVKTAFKEVCKSGNLNGNTIYHRMVSDSLDVGEIFFNIGKYDGLIDIIPCDIRDMINRLSNDGNNAHACLADALEKYLKADAQTYNFNMMKNIYLLNYIDPSGPAKMNIIGATSPATLFFCSANDLSYVTKHVNFNQDKPFDPALKPLFKRDFEYVKTWYILRTANINNFPTLFPEVNEYLDKTYAFLGDAQKNEIKNIQASSAASYDIINVGTANVVEVLGQNILKRKPVTNLPNCQFTIKLTQTIADQPPLVLPVETGDKYSALQYVTGLWGKDYKAPYEDKQVVLGKRKLPCDGTTYSYITISDLLEDTLIKMPHKLNSAHYFPGNIDIDKQDKLSYLIPLKPLFFKYFSADDLIKGVDGIGNLLEMKRGLCNSVNVTLRIPIEGNVTTTYVEYNRTYYNDIADIKHNKGGIKEFEFTGLIMPLVKFDKPEEAYYTVACISAFSKTFSFTFYDKDIPLSDVKKYCRNDDKDNYSLKSENYTLEKSNFSYIRIADAQGYVGLIIPKFLNQSNINTFSFAVDLGTSNIHIEYKEKDDIESKPFDYKRNDALASLFHTLYSNQTSIEILMTQLVEKDFLPNQVGEGDYIFPTRTALSHKNGIDWTYKQEPYILYNISLTYDKRREIGYNKTDTNIKWGSEDYALKACVECLMLMIRNKVLLSKGDLSNTTVMWFYPISMPVNRCNKLKDVWKACYKRFFTASGGLLSNMTESEAPIFYYFKRYANTTNLINIDIGGGTTDIAFSEKGQVKLVTSFKFATNTLFENPFTEMDTKNGIVDFYRNVFNELLREKKINELSIMLRKKKSPSDTASFLFSIKDNSIIKKNNLDTSSMDFNKILQDDDDFKIVFIVYYAAIIYHVAHIIKLKNMKEPRHISFSGNGSKIIKVLSTDPKLIADFTKVIFEHVLGRKYANNLDILGIEENTSPKEATCKGGIVGGDSSLDKDSIVILKGDNSGFVEKGVLYKDITEDNKKSVIMAVEDFLDFALNTLNQKINFGNNFGVTKESLNIAKESIESCRQDINTWLDRGIGMREGDAGENFVEETTFFYPITGVIDHITTDIYDKIKNK